MVHVDPTSGLVVLNAATVPRVVPLPHSNGESCRVRSCDAATHHMRSCCPGSCHAGESGWTLLGRVISADGL
jgi:hypothetical protein